MNKTVDQIEMSLGVERDKKQQRYEAKGMGVEANRRSVAIRLAQSVTTSQAVHIGTALASVQNTLSQSWLRNRKKSLSSVSHLPLYLKSMP